MGTDQYAVLGDSPGPEFLEELSPNNLHLRIKKLNAGYGKMSILHLTTALCSFRVMQLYLKLG